VKHGTKQEYVKCPYTVTVQLGLLLLACCYARTHSNVQDRVSGLTA
jgi:hypothetical protein